MIFRRSTIRLKVFHHHLPQLAQFAKCQVCKILFKHRTNVFCDVETKAAYCCYGYSSVLTSLTKLNTFVAVETFKHIYSHLQKYVRLRH